MRRWFAFCKRLGHGLWLAVLLQAGAASAQTPVCISDNFNTLDANLWNVSGSGYTPEVLTPATTPSVPSNRLRLNPPEVGGVAAYAQFKKWFPGANNKVVVEFDFFAWGGQTPGDGAAMVLSDASVTPYPGVPGGGLGAWQFGGGYLAFGFDEFGNFATAVTPNYPAGYTPPVGANAPKSPTQKNTFVVRGSGVAPAYTAGFNLLANTGTVTPAITTHAVGNRNDSTTSHRYRITVDNSNSTNLYVTVERDTTGAGTAYATVVPTFDARGPNTGQAPVPANLLMSFTSATGGAKSAHEIGNLQVCATSIEEVGSSTPAANFECMDSAIAITGYNNRQTNPGARNPIFTKLSKTPFQFRVVPLEANGAFNSTYIAAGGSAKAVTVEVFDDSDSPRPACNAMNPAKLLATQNTVLNSGVLTTSPITINKATKKLMCRITDNGVVGAPVYGCSSDQFALRPGAVTLATTPTMAAPPLATRAGTIKAGSAFTLQAATTTWSSTLDSSDQYSGTLTLDTAKLTAQTTAQDATQVAGGVVGALSTATLVANAAAATSTTYSEAGYLYLAPGAYGEATFTAVDANGDCTAASSSVTLTNGRYGCVIGNATAVSMGRFIPDRFTVTPGAPVSACSAFTYFSQPEGFATPFSIRALNLDGAVTKNYAGVFARLSRPVWAWTPATNATGLRLGTSAALPAGSVMSVATAGGTAVPSGTWVGGEVTLNNVKQQISRPTALTGETAVTLTAQPTDLDGVTMAAAAAIGTAPSVLRFGRLRMQNAYGSERLALTVPVEAQFYNSAANGFRTNIDDNCTSLVLPAVTTLAGSAVPNGAAGRYFYPAVTGGNQLLSTSSTATVGSANLAGGKSVLQFTAPAARGWLDIILATPDHLKYNWGNCSGQSGTAGLLDDLPCARVTFGVYKSPLIYRRENY